MGNFKVSELASNKPELLNIMKIEMTPNFKGFWNAFATAANNKMYIINEEKHELNVWSIKLF